MEIDLADLRTEIEPHIEWRHSASETINNLTSLLDDLTSSTEKQMADNELETSRLSGQIDEMSADFDSMVEGVHRKLSEPQQEIMRERLRDVEESIAARLRVLNQTVDHVAEAADARLQNEVERTRKREEV